MQINISVKPSFDQVAAAFGDVKAQNFLRDEVRKIALRVERFSKQLTPVDTGRLRSSIAVSWIISEIGAIVRPNTDYAYFVHEGTRYMRARPYMAQGAEFAKQYIEGDIKARIDEEFTKAFKKLH